MTIPKFRAVKKGKTIILSVITIDYENEVVICHLEIEDDIVQEFELRFDEVFLMQSTGLKDKNGVEIFEGDILTDEGGEWQDYWEYTEVRYVSGKYVCVEIYKDGYTGDLEEFEDWAVAGNIYKIPEGLKK